MILLKLIQASIFLIFLAGMITQIIIPLIRGSVFFPMLFSREYLNDQAARRKKQSEIDSQPPK